MTALAVEPRAYTQLIRDAVTGLLADFAPRALCTSEVQRAFRRQDCQRVYNALRKLADRREIVQWHEIDRCWWAAERFPCSSCSTPAERVLTRHVRVDGDWQVQTFYSCTRRLHLEAPLGGFTWRPILSPFYGADPRALAEGFAS